MGIASDLRESVLQAAMQGKLTTQKAEDGDARNLLREIREEKEKLVKDKKIKKEKPLAPITDDETPYDIPDNWVWVRHNDIFSIVGGSQPPKAQFSDTMKDGYVRLYQTRDYGNKPVPVYVSKKSVSKFTKEGDILLARYGGSLGKVFIAHDGAYNVALAKSQNLFKSNLCLTEYKLLFYKSSLYQSFISLMKNGRSAQSGFNKDDLNILLFPLPPLAEQHRIVERVDELMKEIDKLEKTEKELKAIKTAFPADMKSSLLQAAMEGKLTTQKAEDGDARELLREICAEKEKLVKEKKIKKEKPLEPISEDEVPFDVPENWKWCHLGDIFNHNAGKALNARNTKGEKHKYITTSNVYWDHFELDNLKEMYYTQDEVEKYSVRKGDLLVLEGGDIGRTAIWDRDETYCVDHI